MAEGILGRGRRQFPDPRHALQPRHACCKLLLDKGVAGDRRSDPVPRGRHRRARAEIRRRHHHAARLRRVRHRRQQATPSASTTRARTSGRSATRSGAGWSPRSPTRSPTSSSTRRRSNCSCRRSFRRSQAPTIARTRRQARRSIRPRWRRRSPTSTPRCGPAPSTTPILDDCRTEGLTPPKTHWARRIETPPFYAYPVRPGITFTYLGTRVNERGAHADEATASRPPTCSPPARSWPATCSARAMPPASA